MNNTFKKFKNLKFMQFSFIIYLFMHKLLDISISQNTFFIKGNIVVHRCFCFKTNRRNFMLKALSITLF